MATLTARRKVLAAALTGDSVRAVTGSMVAATGRVEFRAAGAGGGDGMLAGLKRRAAGESLRMMEATGTGTAYFAVLARDVTVVDLAGDSLAVESEAILAVTAGLRLDVTFSGLGGLTSGQGVATTTVTGTGQVALLSDGPLIGLAVSPGEAVVVDPDAYVASSGALTMALVSGVSWTSLVGAGSGEPFSLRFDGTGTVYVQPAERAR